MTSQRNQCKTGAVAGLIGIGAFSLIQTPGLTQAPVNVVVDASHRHQTIRGFGTCIGGDAPGPNNRFLNAAFEKAYMQDLGVSILRIEIDPDLAPKALPPDTGYPTLAASLDWDAGGVQGRGQLARALDAYRLDSFKVYATPWTPPGWMKKNGVTHLLDYATGKGTSPTAVKDKNGGWHDPNNIPLPEQRTNFGNYLAAFSQGFSSHFGVPLYAVSVQNELMFDEYYNSCRYDYDPGGIDWSLKPPQVKPGYGAKFSPMFHDAVAAIGKAFQAHGVTTKLEGPESVGPDDAFFSATEGGYIQSVLDDPATAPALNIINIHGYGGDGIHPAGSRTAWANFHKAVQGYGREVWMTEESGEDPKWSTSDGTSRENGAISVAVHIDQALAYGDCNVYLYWQILDPRPSGGALTVADPTRGLDTTAKKYCAAKHFFRYIRPGAVRVDASGDTDTFSVCAFVHDVNKSLTVVMINTASTPQPIHLTLPAAPRLASLRAWRTSADESFAAQPTVLVAHGQASLTLPPRSVVTLYGSSLVRKF